MSKLLGRRWIASGLGLAAFAAVIWYAGPYVAFAGHHLLADPTTRVIAILAVALVFSLNALRRKVQTRSAGNRLVEGLVKSTQTPDLAAEELKVLKGRFAEAMAVLKRVRHNNLQQLPWYVIIGPPGAGKTTALINSGLNFPLADRFGAQALPGVGGTRNCDWWFTDEAVLLDTAGRYTTQDSDAQTDRTAWTGFLDLLKKHRRRLPLNGVLVAVSLADLMLANETERSAHAQAIRQRVQELYEHFGIRLPIYVLLTKADLIAGFIEFFEDLDRETRAQVWGITFVQEESEREIGPLESLDKAYAALVKRLNDRLLARLHQAHDPMRRTLIFGFPREVAALQTRIEHFLAEAFRPNRYALPPLLRGVYFTSATQEGTPIQRLIGQLARTFGLDQQAITSYAGPGRSYFLTRLLREVVFAEAGLGRASRRLVRRRRWLQGAAYAGAIAVALVGTLAWSASYSTNRSYLNDVEAALEEYRAQAVTTSDTKASETDILPQLNALREVVKIAQRHAHDTPLHMRLGLYQGNGVGEAAQDAYVHALNVQLLPLIVRRLEELLQRSAPQPDLQYEALKVYLSLGEPERLEPESLKLWAQLDWQARLHRTPEAQEQLSTHLAGLLTTGIQPVLLDGVLIERVRVNLRRVPLAQFVYGQLKREVPARAPFRVADVTGPAGAQVFTRKSGQGLDAPLPGLFTYQGFHEIFRKESRVLIDTVYAERWVLGLEDEFGDQEFKRLDEEVTALYLRDYITAWQDLLTDLDLVSLQGLDHATEVLEILSAPSSPLRALLEAVTHNTALNQPPAEAAPAEAKPPPGPKDRLTRLLGRTEETSQPTPPQAAPGQLVTEAFVPLHRLLAGSPPPIEPLLALLAELYAHLDTLRAGLGPDTTSLKAADGGEVVRRLAREAARQPEPVKRWLKQVAERSQQVTVGGARSELDAQWRAEILPTCRRITTGRYPFALSSHEDVPLGDFAQLLSYGGLLDQFFQDHLAHLVDTSREVWRWRPVGNAALGLSPETLKQLQQATRIRERFFPAGSREPAVVFSLKPLALSPNVTHFRLEIDGQVFTYRFGPARTETAKWPGPEAGGGVRIVFEDVNGAHHSRVEDGPWALFRILDQVPVERLSAERFKVRFQVDGREATYELRASSVLNPFMMTELKQFSCPESLQ